MDMHATDQHPPRHTAKVAAQVVVTLLVGMVLVLPVRERVAGGRDGRKPVLGGMARDTGAELAQLVTRLCDILANTRPDLDLALQEFRADLIGHFGLAGIHQRLGRDGERECVPVDEQVFLFDPDGEIRL